MRRSKDNRALAARFGVDAHRRHAASMVASAPGFVPEWPFCWQAQLAGWSVEVYGRIDGIVHGEPFVVEELKTGTLAAPESTAFDQLRIYRVVVAERFGSEPVARVRHWAIDRSGKCAETIHELNEPLAESLARIELMVEVATHAAQLAERRGLLRRRWAGLSKFSHARPRPVQREMGARLRDALARGRPAAIHASTGVGKSTIVGFEALRYCLQTDVQLVVVSSTRAARSEFARALARVLRPHSSGDLSESALVLDRQPHAELCVAGCGCRSPRGGSVAGNHRSAGDHELAVLASSGAREEAASFEGTREIVSAAIHPRWLAEIDRRRGGSPLVSGAIIRAAARTLGVCGIDLQSELSKMAEVVVDDYAFAFGGRAPRRALARVVVIDEAHRLPSRRRALARRECRRASLSVVPDDRARSLLRWFDHLGWRRANPDDGGPLVEVQLSRAPPGSPGWTEPDRGEHVPEDSADAGSDVILSAIRCARAIVEDRDEDAVFAEFDGRGRWIRVCVEEVESAVALEEWHRKARGTIVVSATLEPELTWARWLGLERLSPAWIRALRPLEQRPWVWLDTSIDLRARVRARALQSVRERVFRRIGAVLDRVPGRFALFCSSRAMADDLLADLPRSMANARERIWFGILGDAASEGVDLPVDDVVGVIVLGAGVVGPDPVRAAMIRRHPRDEDLDAALLGVMRVVQACGRVGRQPGQRAIAIVIDRRFERADLRRALPRDWYDSDSRELLRSDPWTELARITGSSDAGGS